VEKIKNVAQAGRRTNNPAKEYFHNIFGISARFLLIKPTRQGVYCNRNRRSKGDLFVRLDLCEFGNLLYKRAA
jgi:hypothetical protein